MATGRSCAEFVKDKCYNGLYQAAEEYVNQGVEVFELIYLEYSSYREC